MAECYEDCGGGDGLEPSPGYYLTAWWFSSAPDGSDWDPWPSGEPEFEATIFHNAGYIGSPDNNYILVDGNFYCASEEYEPGHARYWDYNNPPHAGTGTVLLLDPSGMAEMGTVPSGDFIDLLISENDDTPCPGHFPSVGNPEPLFNDDDWLGEFNIFPDFSSGTRQLYPYIYQIGLIRY